MKMKVLLGTLAAVSGLSSVPLATAQNPRPPPGRSCQFLQDREFLPAGYCRGRTKQDDDAVKEWNENKGKGIGNGKGDGNVRRRLVDETSPPAAFGYTPFAPGEYEAVEGILLAYDPWDLDVVAGIAAAVANQSVETKVYMVVPSSRQKRTAEREFNSASVNMARVVWITEPIDSVWIRDYGPRFICDSDLSGTRDAVDTQYYGSRQRDDTLPTKLGNGNEIGPHTNYDLNAQVFHSGGNAHYFSTGKAFASQLILSDNGGAWSEQSLKDHWIDYKGADLSVVDRLSPQVDGTGHIDMWFLPVDDTTVIIGEWATEDSYGSKALTDGMAAYMASSSYTVYRVPNWNAGGAHYTYTNAVIANDVVVLSSYGDLYAAEDAAALGVFQAAFPTKTIVQVDSSGIISRSGALHCIAQHVYDCSGGGLGPSTTESPPGTTTTETPVTPVVVTTTEFPPGTTTTESPPGTTTTETPPGTTTTETPPDSCDGAGCVAGGVTCSGSSCQNCCCGYTNVQGAKTCNSV